MKSGGPGVLHEIGHSLQQALLTLFDIRKIRNANVTQSQTQRAKSAVSVQGGREGDVLFSAHISGTSRQA